MSYNNLKFRDKTIEALKPIAYGRLRLAGPRFEDYATYDRPKNSPGTPICTSSGRHKVADGERCECEQTVAYNLCVKEHLATLLRGGAFNVIEQRDGAHLIELWNPNTQYGPPNSLFQAIEKVETLVPDLFAPGMPVETQLRIRAVDWLAGAAPRDCLWEGEPANPPTPDGGGNPNHKFRILRSNPTPKVVALNQNQQRAMMKELWDKVFPDQPLVGAGATLK